jgi:tetratricopeptide (TPR) repeat protein
MNFAIRGMLPTILVVAQVLQAQQAAPNIRLYVSMVDAGQIEQVRTQLPALLERHPNHPGVLYVQGLVATDGAEAVRIYQSIVDNFPKSEWADDALYKVYQFYYALGLYRTAELKLAQLKTDYPTSKYVVKPAETSSEKLAEEQEPPGPVSSPLREIASTSSPGGFALQVGAYSAQENAEKQRLFFEDLKMPVEVINRVKDGRSLYIVLVGTFNTADEARAQGSEIKKSYNIESFIISR